MNQKIVAYALVALLPALLVCGLGTDEGTDLVWSTFLGEGDTDEGFGIAVDGSGNVYVTGIVRSVDFPTTSHAFDRTHNGQLDAFVAKFNSTGNALDYATFLGGSSDEYGWDIAADGSGCAYVTGMTKSRDFPTTAGALDTSYNGGSYDAFVAKLDASGNTLAYSTFLGGNHRERGKSIAVDGSGHAYVAGWTMSADFPTTYGAFHTSHHGRYKDDAFAAKLNPAGSGLDYATFLGGANEDWGLGIAVDGHGSAYVAVLTYSLDFPTTVGAFDRTYNGHRDALVAKLNPAGSALVYATFLGGSNQDWPQGIVTDRAGNAYLTGATYSVDFPTTSEAFDSTYRGFTDVFVVEIDPTASALVYSSLLGGGDAERGTGIALDGAGNLYVTGWTRSVDFPTTAGALNTSHSGQSDAFVAKLKPAGSGFAYLTFLGGDSVDVGRDIAVDESGSVYVTGWTRSVDFPTTVGAFDSTYSGAEEAFVVKLDLSGYSRSGRIGRLRSHR